MDDTILHYLGVLAREAQEKGPRDDAGEISPEALGRLLSLNASLQAELREQQARIKHLEHMVAADDLTGLFNRRGFIDQFGRSLSGTDAGHQTGSVIIADFDGFKQINDRYGHAAGDAMLCHFAKLIRTHTDHNACAARFGGDEFAILLRDVTEDDTRRWITKFRKVLATSPMMWQQKLLTVSASFGHAIYVGGDDIDTLLAAADHNMYLQKRAMRGRPDQSATSVA